MTEVPWEWDERTNRVYLVTLAWDIRHAQTSFEKLATCAERSAFDPQIWPAISSFLASTARVSKMLNPIGYGSERPKKAGNSQVRHDRRHYRADSLRTLLEIDEGSAILDRAVRDADEHFDDRLDAWAANLRLQTYEEVIADGLEWSLPPLRILDGGALVVTIDQATLALEPIRAELDRILHRVVELEPLAGWANLQAAAALSSLPVVPIEMRLDAPSQRPDEDIRMGIAEQRDHDQAGEVI